MSSPRGLEGLRGALLVAGTASGVGKSTVTAGLCRLLAREGCSVAPFKAQNMSNHAAVTADGGEVGRAQAVQAAAAGVDVETAMNPILLKPSSAAGSHVVVLGREVGTTDARGWGARSPDLRPVVLDALVSLRRRFDVVVAEGAGGAAEINLLDRDLVNLPLARAAGMRTLLVADIDRGGAFAAAHGTIDLVPPELASSVAGVVLNRFRGDASLISDGCRALEARTGVPVLGVLPDLGPAGLLATEDSLDVGSCATDTRSPDPVRVVAVRLPHLANPSDLDPLAVEPDVELRWATRPGALADADLVVLPGSRATVSDLAWLRATGIADAVVRSARRDGTHVLGICAGQQLLGRTITDHVESGAGTVAGLGLLDCDTEFTSDKVVARRTGWATTGGGGCGTPVEDRHPVSGYQIHLGRTPVERGWLELDGDAGPSEDGATSAGGRVRGTTLHGLLDADGLRAALLSAVARDRGRTFSPDETGFAGHLDAQHDRLADWLDTHLDVRSVCDVVAAATPVDEAPGWA